MKKNNLWVMATAISVLMAGIAIFTACNKDDDKKDDKEKVIPEGYVDLGLESGTCWKKDNDTLRALDNGPVQRLFQYYEALDLFGNTLPTKEQWRELKMSCNWHWTGSGCEVTGPNGNSIILPAEGGLDCIQRPEPSNNGYYWGLIDETAGTNGGCYLLSSIMRV